MDLREEIAQQLAADYEDRLGNDAMEYALDKADRILAIPRIAAALKLLDEQERLKLGHGVKVR